MKKIVIVEDDLIVANIYRNKFCVEGYQVEVAADGQSGLEVIRNTKPDAVLLDLMLPKLTGVELMKKLRAEPAFEKLPIIVFSNTYLTNMVQEAWKAGASKCLSKANCSPKQVLELVRNTLQNNGGAPADGPPPAPTAANIPAPAKTPPDYIKAADKDSEFQAELRKSFLDGLPGILTAVRAQLKALIKAESDVARLAHLHEMYRRIHGLTGNAAITGMYHIAQMADALEALLKELYEKPASINVSTLRTVASALDFLGLLLERGAVAEMPGSPPAKVLVVDDEAISRRAITHALEKARLKSVSVADPQAAYSLLAEHKFDLIFLDVDMPGMNGHELCAKVRALPQHKKTPVVFVTGLNDLESRASSLRSGGNDFIAKPFLFIELAVKALVYVLRGRLGPGQVTRGKADRASG